jgi:hypothetical protein
MSIQGMSIKILAVILGMMALAPSAFAAGISSHAYTCLALHNLIATTGFVFINNPTFEDFVVANVSYCGGGGGANAQLQLRSVPTTDTPECLVNYCAASRSPTGISGGM